MATSRARRLYRSSDPSTSAESAASTVNSPSYGAKLQETLAALAANQGYTAREIASRARIGHESCRKRLSDLRLLGEAVPVSPPEGRLCSISGKRSQLWYTSDQAPGEAEAKSGSLYELIIVESDESAASLTYGPSSLPSLASRLRKAVLQVPVDGFLVVWIRHVS